MLATLNMGSFPIVNVGAPVAATDAATKGYVDSALTPGFILSYAVNAVPAGWLACDGSSLSTTTYANLFAKVNYAFGGSGSSFNLPDYRGTFLRGFDNGRGLDTQGTRAAGAFQDTAIINHFHAVGDPTHSHSVSDPGHTHGASTGGHSHNLTLNSHAHGSGLMRFVGAGGTLGIVGGGNVTSGNNTDATGNFGGSADFVGNLGVTVNGAGTGIAIFGNYTGISVSSVSTGTVWGETVPRNYPVLWCIKY